MKICWHRGKEAWRNVKQDLLGLPSHRGWHGPGPKAILPSFTGGLGSRSSSTELLIVSGPSWEWKPGQLFSYSHFAQNNNRNKECSWHTGCCGYPEAGMRRNGERKGANRFITNDSSPLLFLCVGPSFCLSLFLALSMSSSAFLGLSVCLMLRWPMQQSDFSYRSTKPLFCENVTVL